MNPKRIFDAFNNSKDNFDSSESHRDYPDERLKPDGQWEGGDDRQEKMHATELQKTIKLAMFLLTICVVYITFSSFSSSSSGNNNNEENDK